MTKLILSEKTKKSIQRKVWRVWALRKSIPLAGLVVVAVVESFFVSFSSVLANTIGAAQNIGALSNYWFTAIVGAELYVLAGAAVLVVGGVYFARSTILDLQFMSSTKRERISSF